MKDERGITLIVLAIIIVIMVIFSAVSISSVVTSYKSVVYETAVAELEEIQTAVTEMIEDYTLLKETNSNIINYSSYFEERYGTPKTEATSSVGEIAEVVSRFSLTYNQYLFYFDNDEIKTFFGLEVSVNSVLVDFATGYVYDPDGFTDTSGTVYYSLVEAGVLDLTKNDEATKSNAKSITVTPESGALEKSGNTEMLKITLGLNRSETGTSYQIKKAYYQYSKTGTDNSYNGKIAVDYLGNCIYDGDTVSFVITDSGYYIFSIEDTSGKEVYLDLSLYSSTAVEYTN